MPRSSLLLVAASLACACGFSVTAVARPMRLHSATSQLAMKAPVEEKKTGLAAFFGGGNKVDGKVVPTKKGGKQVDEEEEMDENKKLLQQVKDAGVAGIISYVFWEWVFWGISIPVCIFTYQAATGHFPDFSNQEDLSKLGAEAFAFVNVARFAIPLRIGLALSTTPWVQANIVDKFNKGDDN